MNAGAPGGRHALDVRGGAPLVMLRCGNCDRLIGEAVMVPGLRTRNHCPRCKAWSCYLVPPRRLLVDVLKDDDAGAGWGLDPAAPGARGVDHG